MNEDKPMQTNPIHFSSDEDTTLKLPLFKENSPEDENTQVQTLSVFVVHPNDPRAAAHVTISRYDVEMTNFFSSATIN